MRTTFLSLLLTISAIANAQTWHEWFNQKETQKKYLLQQIANLKVYIDYAERGYTIANQGLQTVRSIKKGDFDLHNEFFNSLKQVNPAIQVWNRVEDIIAIEVKIAKRVKGVMSSVSAGAQFTAAEIEYCKTVLNRLVGDCLEDLDELMVLTTSGKLQMTDDERMNRIGKVFLKMQDKYAFVNSFSDEMKILSAQRLKEMREIDLSRLLLK